LRAVLETAAAFLRKGSNFRYSLRSLRSFAAIPLLYSFAAILFLVNVSLYGSESDDGGVG
jgi:hypothetical protein